VTLLPPLEMEAKADIFSLTLLLPQAGHTTSETASALRTSFSNAAPHSEQSNSKRGISLPFQQKLSSTETAAR
jgi:hypothetical protein